MTMGSRQAVSRVDAVGNGELGDVKRMNRWFGAQLARTA